MRKEAWRKKKEEGTEKPFSRVEERGGASRGKPIKREERLLIGRRDEKGGWRGEGRKASHWESEKRVEEGKKGGGAREGFFLIGESEKKGGRRASHWKGR